MQQQLHRTSTLRTFAVAAALLSLALPTAMLTAQDAPAQPAPEKPAPAPAPEKPAPEQPEPTPAKPAPDPAFATRAALLAHFEPIRGELLTKLDAVREDPDHPGAAEKQLADLRDKLAAVDARHLAALRAFIAANPARDDAAIARRDVVEFCARLGKWADAADAGAAFLSLHATTNEDMTREVRYMRADALMHIEGREEDAATALKEIITVSPASREAEFARVALIRAYLYLDRVPAARDLLDKIAASSAVKDDDEAQAWVAEERQKLDRIGKAVPDCPLTPREGAAIRTKDFTATKTVLWFWDTTSGPCLEELPLVESAVRDALKAAPGALRACSVSLNRSESAWRQWLDAAQPKPAPVPAPAPDPNKPVDNADKNADKPAAPPTPPAPTPGPDKPASPLTPYFQGLTAATNPDGTAAELLSKKLSVAAIPLAVLINADGTVFRFDVPAVELPRVLRAWLKPASAATPPAATPAPSAPAK
jgi:hypothetical protein